MSSEGTTSRIPHVSTRAHLYRSFHGSSLASCQVSLYCSRGKAPAGLPPQTLSYAQGPCLGKFVCEWRLVVYAVPWDAPDLEARRCCYLRNIRRGWWRNLANGPCWWWRWRWFVLLTGFHHQAIPFEPWWIGYIAWQKPQENGHCMNGGSSNYQSHAAQSSAMLSKSVTTCMPTSLSNQQ